MMLATSARTALVLLLTASTFLGATDALPVHRKVDLDLDLGPPTLTAAARIYAHTQLPEQRIGHTMVGRQDSDVGKPPNDPSSVSSLLSRPGTATAASYRTTSSST